MKVHSSYQKKDKKGFPMADHRKNLRNLSGLKRVFSIVAVKIFNDGLYSLNRRAYAAIENNPKAIVIDLGTGDSELLEYFNKKIKSKNLYGLDLIDNDDSDVKVIISDLEKNLPLKSNSYDVVISSQNIEHIIDLPSYCDEITRILKFGGYAIILTENLASWVNIGALMLGWLPFSMTNMLGLSFGNPLVRHSGLHNEEEIKKAYSKKAWGILGHQRVLTIKAYRDLFEKRGLVIEKTFGGGYGLFWGLVERIFSGIDKTHSHFIGLKIRKPLKKNLG